MLLIPEKEFNSLLTKIKVLLKCDYCGKEFERTKSNILRSRTIITKDCCADQSCVGLKKEESNLKKFGYKNAMQNNAIKEKFKESNINKFGVAYPMQNKSVKEKAEQTNLKKFGTKHPLENKKIKEKAKETNKQRFGTEIPSKNPEVAEKIKQSVIRTKQLNKNDGIRIIKRISNGITLNEIKNWVNSFGNDFEASTGVSLYSNKHKLGIQFCELLLSTEHSDPPVRAKINYERYKIYLKNGIRVITIFEDEWTKRNNQVKNLLKSVLNIFNKRVYARKCEIKEINKIIANKFYDENHIQGKIHNIKIAYGLFYENELLGVMSLGMHHRKSEELVLNRLAFKDGIQVIGGSSRLFKYCINYAKENNYNKIISWSDNRYSQGNVYEKLNFILEEELKQDYSYVDMSGKQKVRSSKQSCKKGCIGCPVEFTEREWMIKLGYSRIWDCGKKRFVFNIIP